MHCLIIEDDPTLCFSLRTILTDLGHQTHSVRTLAAAQTALDTRKFDLIILDYLLPDGTSVDLSSYAAMTQPNCRIIMLTGHQVFLAGENKQIAPGIDWVLRKPVSLKDLSALVDYAARDLEWNPTAAHATP